MSESTLIESDLLSAEMSTAEKITFLSTLLKNLTDYSIIAADLTGVILAWNKGAEFHFGYVASEIIGKNLYTLQSNQESPKKLKAFLRIVRQKGRWSQVLDCISKTGKPFAAYVTIVLSVDQNEQALGYTIFSYIIGESEKIFNKLKHTEQLLKTKNKDFEDLEVIKDQATGASRLKSEFLANVSHELRTPLNAIVGFAELMYLGKVGPVSQDHREYLQEILGSSKQLLLLINDLLDLTKVESGKTEFNHEPIDIKKIVEDTQETFSAIVLKKNMQLKVEIDPLLGNIIIDPSKLRQVFFNYVSNALKFAPIGGSVMIRVSSEENNTFRIEVEDNGIGIDEKNLELLFVPFQQVDSSSTKKFQGTGLGLSLTKKIVEAQGGKVGVTSELGKGSIFYAILPCSPLVNKETELLISKEVSKEETEYTASIPKILVVEEESPERDTLIKTLEEKGYVVETASSINDALKFNLVKYDAILLDLFLPDLSSWKILRSLRTKNPVKQAPILLVTVIAEKATGIGFKIHDFLIKPVLPKDLLAAFAWVGAAPHTAKNVLIFDDDEEALTYATKLLTKGGYHVICKKDIKSALLAIEEYHPDVLLLDPYMSKLEGFELLHRFRKSKKGLYTPVIIWTIKNLSDEERFQIRTQLQQRVMVEGEDITKSLIEEIKNRHPIAKKN